MNTSLWLMYNEFTYWVIFYSNIPNSLFDKERWKWVCVKFMINLKKEWPIGVQVSSSRSRRVSLISFTDTCSLPGWKLTLTTAEKVHFINKTLNIYVHFRSFVKYAVSLVACSGCRSLHLPAAQHHSLLANLQKIRRSSTAVSWWYNTCAYGERSHLGLDANYGRYNGLILSHTSNAPNNNSDLTQTLLWILLLFSG